MKIGVISDTHIADTTTAIPAKILQDFKNVDMVLHAGDLTDLNVIEQLKKSCPHITAVYGNMDSSDVREKLPEKKIIKAGNYKIGLMHGAGAPAQLVEFMARAFKDDNVDIIVFGHSHRPLNEEKEGILFFNPGSAMDKVYAPYNSYGIIELNGKIEAKIIKL